MSNVGKSIRLFREHCGMARETLAGLMACSVSQIQRLESDKHNPHVTTIELVAYHLGIPPAFLLLPFRLLEQFSGPEVLKGLDFILNFTTEDKMENGETTGRYYVRVGTKVDFELEMVQRMKMALCQLSFFLAKGNQSVFQDKADESWKAAKALAIKGESK